MRPLVCMQHIRTDVLRERSRMPSDLRDRIPLRRIFKTRTEAPRAHHGYAAPARTAPSRVHDPAQADRGTCCGPQLPASDRRKPARGRVPSLRCCAPRTPARVSLPRNAQPLHRSDQGYAGKRWGGRTMYGYCASTTGHVRLCSLPSAGEPSGPEADHGPGHYITRCGSSSRRTADPRHPSPPRPTPERRWKDSRQLPVCAFARYCSAHIRARALPSARTPSPTSPSCPTVFPVTVPPPPPPPPSNSPFAQTSAPPL